VNPQAQLVFHSAASAAYAASHRASTAEYLAYLGPPLLILVAAVTVWYWRDLRVKSAGVTWAVLEALWQGTSSPSDTGFPSDTAATQGGSCAADFRSALGYWHPAAVVADTGQGTLLGRFLIGVLGQPAVKDGQLLAWRNALAENGTANC
jgi:hypothetical protein